MPLYTIYTSFDLLRPGLCTVTGHPQIHSFSRLGLLPVISVYGVDLSLNAECGSLFFMKIAWSSALLQYLSSIPAPISIALNMFPMVSFGLSAMPFCDDDPAAVRSMEYPCKLAILLNFSLPANSPPWSVLIAIFKSSLLLSGMPCLIRN